MNVVQLICLILSIGLFAWVAVSFVLSLVRKHKAKNDKSVTGNNPEEGVNEP